MADQGCADSRFSTENEENLVEIRPCGQDPSGDNRPGNRSDDKSVQTEKVPVRHTGVQLDPPVPMDVDTTDTQMTAASSVNVESSSGTQIGGGNTIVNNYNTYNVNIFTHADQIQPDQLPEIIRSAELVAESEDQSPGDVTNLILDSNSMKKIKTLTSQTVTRSESHVPNNATRTVTSQPHHPSSTSRDVQSPETNIPQTAEPESTERKQIRSNEENCQPVQRMQKRNAQENHNAFNDVTNTSTSRRVEKKMKKDYAPQTPSQQTPSQQTPTGSRSAETQQRVPVQDSIFIIDSSGRTLVPGDVVWIGSVWSCRAIYRGHKQVVRCRRRDGRWMVKKEELDLTRPFGKCRVTSDGECRVFPPGDRVRRAESWVGTEYKEGDWHWRDFPAWVCCDMDWIQAHNRGFRLKA